MAKLGVSERQNRFTDCHKIWRGWLRRRFDPARQNSNRSPQWGRPGIWVKYHCRMVISFLFETSIFARVPRPNRRSDFYAA